MITIVCREPVWRTVLHAYAYVFILSKLCVCTCGPFSTVAFSAVRKGRSGVSTDVVEIPQDVIAERANSSGL